MGHGNLSPRQKMINIMYLILTALLAMNVSAEVLNAFVLVNDSLVKTEEGINKKNYDVYTKFNSMNAVNPTKVGPWLKKASEVESESKALITYIDTLISKIIVNGGDVYSVYKSEGTKSITKKDDKEGPLYVMLEDKSQGKIRANELKEELQKFREKVSLVLKGVPKSETILESMNKNLNTDDIIGQEGKAVKWERANFDLPMVAVITMLTKLKTDVLNTESDAINSLLERVDAATYKFTGLKAIVTSEKGYVLSGEPYNAKIFVAAYDTTMEQVIQLDDGTKITEFDKDGKGIFSITKGPGVHSLKGTITIPKPGSETEVDTFNFESEYQVAVPSVSVSPTKMNVFYIGVDNPVEITAAGTPADKISPSLTSGSIRRKGGSEYIVRVKKPGRTKVVVSANGRTLGSKEFRVKSLPNPVTTIGAPSARYFKGGNIPQSTLLALSGINATMENFEFDLRFNITGFVVTCNIGGFDESAKANGRKFTTQQKSIIRKARKNSRVIIEGVRAKGPDGKTRKINDLVFKLK
ncbi:MAG: gliding motility protein GldM [Bacteroidales bacterium]|nr:gliding motility protein GldM [Bacteroidales bacterium]